MISLEAGIRDPETGLYSRYYFDEVIGRELERARRHAFELSVVSVVLDFGTKGPAREETLQTLVAAGRVLEANTRETDLVFRWETDEFLVLLFEADALDCRKKVEVLGALYATWVEETPAHASVRVRIGSGTLEEGRVFAGVLQSARACARQTA